MTLNELLPPGVYPIWSPYDSYEAAKVLTSMLVEEEAQKPGNKLPVSAAKAPTVLRTEKNAAFRPLDDQPQASQTGNLLPG